MRAYALLRSFIAAGALVGCATAGAQPARIMSLNLCTDVLVLHLAEREHIASLSFIATDSPLSPIVAAARGIPSNHASIEELVATAPDLVVARRHTASATVSFARRFGYRVLELDDPNSYDAAVAQIREAAHVLGEAGRGEKLITRMQARLAGLPPASGPRPRALVYGPNGYVFGAGSLLDDLIRRAGLRNIAAEQGMGRAGTVALENLLFDPPDLIFFERESERVSSLADESLRHPALRRLAARIPQADISSRLWNCAGPDIAEVVVQMAAVRARAERLE